MGLYANPNDYAIVCFHSRAGIHDVLVTLYEEDRYIEIIHDLNTIIPLGFNSLSR